MLQRLPGIGGLFHGFFGLWLVLIGLSLGLGRLAAAARRRRRLESDIRALGTSRAPHNQGKLGACSWRRGERRRPSST